MVCADLYFTLATLVCVACLLAYTLVLPRLPAMQYSRSLLAESDTRGSFGGGDEQRLVDSAHASKSPTADLPLGQAILGYRTTSELAELTHKVMHTSVYCGCHKLAESVTYMLQLSEPQANAIQWTTEMLLLSPRQHSIAAISSTACKLECRLQHIRMV